MVDVASNGTAAANTAAAPTAEAGQYESDFSPRKIKIASVILLGQTFGTSILPFTALSFLYSIMHTEFGWGFTEYAYATTALMMVGACSVPFLGYFVDKIGARPIIIIGTFMVGVVTMSISQTNSLLTFCIAFGLLGFFGSVGVAYGKVIAALFTKNRGKGLAILGAESAVAMAITPQIINFLITNYGWRQSFVIEGILIILCVPILYFTLHEPGTTGGSRNLFKFIKTKSSAMLGSHEPPPTALDGMTLKQAVYTRVFWLILLALLIAAAPRAGLWQFLAPLLDERGFGGTDNGRAAAANFISLVTLAGAVGSLAIGFFLDKFHTAKVAVPFKLMSLVALVMLAVVSSAWGGFLLLTATGVLWGFASGTARPSGSYFQTRFFGLKGFGGISGFDAFFTAMFMGIIAPVVARSRELTGSFDMAMWIMSGALLIGALIYFVLGPYKYGVMVGATPAQPKR